MSKIGQSIIDTPYEEELDAMQTLEPIEYGALGANPTPEEEAEAMEAQAIWSAVTTLKDYLWEVNVVVGGTRYSGLITSKHEPDHRQAAAVIATVYGMGTSGASKIIDLIRKGTATVVVAQPMIHDEDTIKDNYIPF